MSDDNVESSPTTDEVTETVDAETAEVETTDTAHEEDSPASEDQPESTTPESDGEPASEPEQQITDRAKAETPAEKRIKQLLAQNKQLKQRMDRYERPAQDPELGEAPKAPKEEDFKSYSEFETAKADYEQKRLDYATQKAIVEDRRRQAEIRQREEQQQQLAEAQQSWKTKVTETAKRNPQFDFAKAIDAVKPNDTSDRFIADSPIGPDLLDHLAKHPEEAEELREMSPFQVTRALTRLEDKLQAQIAGIQPKKTPKAPAYVSGGAAPKKEKSLEDILYG